MRGKTILVLCLLVWLAASASAEVVRFQNGVAPTPEYRGCMDTRISIYNDSEARGPSEGQVQQLLTFSTARRILVRFDLGAVPGERAVRRALLRIYCTRPTSLSSAMFAAPITREWDDTATGFEFKRTDDDKTPEGNWDNKGGDYDQKATIEAPCRGGGFGHGFEFDVTAVVADWLAGKRPNCGMILWSSQHTQHEIASSEWPLAAYRPELLIDLAAPGQAEVPVELKPWPPPAKTIELSAAAQLPGGRTAEGPYRDVRLGLRNDAELREGAADAYVKTSPRLAGQWGWMPHLRVGGGAGDFNAALLAFDLKGLPRAASVKSARLRLYVAAGAPGVRFGAYLARDSAPAWEAASVSAQQAKAGLPWPEGGYRAAFQDKPAAAAAITQPPKDAPDQQPYIEWDLTGAVRSRLGALLSLLIDADLEGGAFDAFSSKYDEIDLRPVLLVEVSPSPTLPSMEDLRPPGVPAGDYWLEPMRAAHKRFQGDAHTLGQYGDSITITMAFLATHSYGSIIPQKCPEDVKRRLEIVDGYANKKLWREWKDPRYGNNGNMTVAWAFANIDTWQKLCKPEVAVILFGTNDVSNGPIPPTYTEYMASVVDRCLADGTVPILTTLPPRGDQKGEAPHNLSVAARVREIRRAVIAVARSRQVPLIDFYEEILTRQPEEWDKKLMGDSLHPSYRDPWKMDFTDEGLKNSGYTLRNYLTMMTYADIIEKVLARSPAVAPR